MKIIAYIFRFLLGAVFIFSGIVKAIDPLGSAYKFMDYFAAFNMQWMDSFAVFLSIFMSALEFIIGAALFFGIVNRLASWGGLLFMSFFTPLTLYLAIKNPVTDCGCFGDALIMTNWETFYKNVALIIFAIVTFIYRKKFKKILSCKKELILAVVLALIPVFISIYGLRHLPIIDFRAWKVGSSMKLDTSVEDKYYVSYQNKETGEIQEYLSPNFPWDDPEWVENWEFIGQRVDAAPFPENYIYIGDENGQDYFKTFTQHPDYQFLLVMYYIEDANLKNMENIKQFAIKSFENNIDFIAITGSTPKTVAEFKETQDIQFEVFYSDEITLKTIIRSNPGLVLIKDGTILDKWSHRDIPKFEDIDFEKLSQKYLKTE
jgi:uncharacterized membrane protein YphA (DoxX/SURF4 family)